jgi:hypothetical protein
MLDQISKITGKPYEEIVPTAFGWKWPKAVEARSGTGTAAS